MMSEKTKVINAYRALSPEDKAIVDRVIMKIQMSPKNGKSVRSVPSCR